jgi:pyruvate-ferredoxin/flavodoxin oxidoreductase
LQVCVQPSSAFATRSPQCKPPTLPLQKDVYNETRDTMLAQTDPGGAKALLADAQRDVQERWRRYEDLARPSGAPAEVRS